MSNQLQLQTLPPISVTAYAIISNSLNQFWNGSGFEAYNSANQSEYAVIMTEQNPPTPGLYYGNFPSGIVVTGSYSITVYQQGGGSPVSTDDIIGYGSYWYGSGLTSVDYVKQVNQIITDSTDNAIELMIASLTTAFINYWNGWTPVLTSYSETIDGFGTDYIRTRWSPINTLTSISLNNNLPQALTVNGSEFVFNPRTGVVQFLPLSTYRQWFLNGFQNITINYTAGYTLIPQDIQNAMAGVIGKLLFSENQARVGITSKTIGDRTITLKSPIDLNFENPIFAEWLPILKKYRPISY